jgi:hypothetical protein
MKADAETTLRIMNAKVMSNRSSLILFSLLLLVASFCRAQTTVVLSPIPQFVSYLPNGSPNAFGCVFTYASNTTTPLASYTDSTGATQNANPVVLSAGGNANIWLAAGSSYTIKVVAYSGAVNCVGGSTVYVVNGIGGGGSVLTTNVTWSSTPLFTDQSQIQLFTITLAGNTTALPLVVTGVTPPGLITFQITENSTGGWSFVWPSNMVGGAQIGTNANQVTTQSFIWNGTTAIATDAAVIGAGPALSTGSLTVAGSVAATGGVSSSNQGTEISVANASTTGTTLNTVTIMTGAPQAAVIAPTSTIGGVIGITVANAGTSGNATIQQSGIVSCVFDGGTTAGDLVLVSTSTAGECHDSGSAGVSGTSVGTVLSTNGSAGTYQILLNQGSSGGGASCADGSTTTVNASTTATQVMKTCQLPSGVLNAIGKTFRYTFANSLNASGSARGGVDFGLGTNATLGNNQELIGVTGGGGFSFSAMVTCIVTATGSNGSLSCEQVSQQFTASFGSPTIANATLAFNVISLNLTGPIYVGVGCTFSTSSSSNTCSQTIQLDERLN